MVPLHCCSDLSFWTNCHTPGQEKRGVFLVERVVSSVRQPMNNACSQQWCCSCQHFVDSLLAEKGLPSFNKTPLKTRRGFVSFAGFCLFMRLIFFNHLIFFSANKKMMTEMILSPRYPELVSKLFYTHYNDLASELCIIVTVKLLEMWKPFIV